MAYINDVPKQQDQLHDAVESVKGDLRIVVNKQAASGADCVAPSRPPVLLDPEKPLKP